MSVEGYNPETGEVHVHLDASGIMTPGRASRIIKECLDQRMPTLLINDTQRVVHGFDTHPPGHEEGINGWAVTFKT